MTGALALFPLRVLRGRVRVGVPVTGAILQKPPPQPSPGVPGEGVKAIFAIAIICSILFLSSSVRAADSSALINEALDKLVSLQLDGPLPQVMKKIEDQTAVPIRVVPEVYAVLPWGEQTTVGVKIQNKSLRDALTSICQHLGLTWELGAQAVEIKPSPPLARLGRRATVEELNAVALLADTPMGLNIEHSTVQQLVDAVDQKLSSLKSAYAVEFRPGEQIKADAPVNIPRNATMAEALESLDKDNRTDAAWYPWGKSIVVLPKEQVVLQQLRRTVNRRFNNTDLGQVLTELSQSAGVDFEIEAGALQRVPPEFRKITLLLDSAPIRQALDDIRGVTGLDYVIKPNGVYLWNQNPNPTSAAANNSPIFATLQLDNGMTLFLRENDLPPDIRQFAEKKKRQEYKRLREMMKDEGFVPSTQPATKPAKQDL
jgi:hypothetical protein